jgi:hypothetical protein
MTAEDAEDQLDAGANDLSGCLIEINQNIFNFKSLEK